VPRQNISLKSHLEISEKRAWNNIGLVSGCGVWMVGWVGEGAEDDKYVYAICVHYATIEFLPSWLDDNIITPLYIYHSIPSHTEDSIRKD